MAPSNILSNITGLFRADPRFLSPSLDARANINTLTGLKSIDASTRSLQYSPQTTTNFSPVDARQLVLNINSAGAVTKKSDKISAPSFALENAPSNEATGAKLPLDVRPSFDIGAGSNIGLYLLIGGVVVGAGYFLSSKKKK